MRSRVEKLKKIILFFRKTKGIVHVEIQEIKRVKWITEFIKGFSVAVLTAATLYLFRINSPGSLEGEELEKYLYEEICRVLNLNDTDYDIELETPYALEYENVSNSKAIIVYGKYIPKNDYGQVGRFICLFERGSHKLLNDVIGTQAKYETAFACYTECDNDSDTDYYLYYVGALDKNIDKDGKREVVLSLKSNYADRISDCLVVLTNQNKGWTIATIDSDELKKSISDAKEDMNTIVCMNDSTEEQEGLSIQWSNSIMENFLSNQTVVDPGYTNVLLYNQM